METSTEGCKCLNLLSLFSIFGISSGHGLIQMNLSEVVEKNPFTSIIEL